MTITLQIQATPGEYRSHLLRGIAHAFLRAGFTLRLKKFNEGGFNSTDEYSELTAIQDQTKIPCSIYVPNEVETQHHLGFPYYPAACLDHSKIIYE